MHLQDVAARLLPFIEDRQRFLSVNPKGSPVKMTAAQHLETARLLLHPERLIRILDLNKEAVTPQSEIDLTMALDSFYVGLAHLGAAYDVRWAVDRGGADVPAAD